ncbi:hypothetical protein [Mesorhizobium sp. WSM3862]|uniref:hypothetical protein n=1 Tax=Mesorhizobium sp. WSM3862 TaxID=632858 RepID=UPI000BDAA36C|nr:hypothetical protein [Mesorhizobium sp. WSM3862]PBB98326.1 hypothetical protein CK224_09575 [Mesorhizobium sp. WSM3862]
MAGIYLAATDEEGLAALSGDHRWPLAIYAVLIYSREMPVTPATGMAGIYSLCTADDEGTLLAGSIK